MEGEQSPSTSAVDRNAFIELFYLAYNSKYGIVVKTNDPERFRQKAWRFRKELGDEDLSCLRFAISPLSPADEVWILKDVRHGESDSETVQRGSGDTQEVLP